MQKFFFLFFPTFFLLSCVSSKNKKIDLNCKDVFYKLHSPEYSTFQSEEFYRNDFRNKTFIWDLKVTNVIKNTTQPENDITKDDFEKFMASISPPTYTIATLCAGKTVYIEQGGLFKDDVLKIKPGQIYRFEGTITDSGILDFPRQDTLTATAFGQPKLMQDVPTSKKR